LGQFLGGGEAAGDDQYFRYLTSTRSIRRKVLKKATFGSCERYGNAARSKESCRNRGKKSEKLPAKKKIRKGSSIRSRPKENPGGHG